MSKNVYVSSVAYASVAQWAATHSYAAGSIVRQLAAPSVGNERCFRTAAGGTSGSSEPTWVLTFGSASPTDGSVTDWIEVTGNETYQVSGNWKAPHARTPNCIASGQLSAGDAIMIANNSAETQASTLTITMPSSTTPGAAMCGMYSVDPAGSVPPTAVSAGAAIANTGSNSMVFAGRCVCAGITFTCASSMTCTNNVYSDWAFLNCALSCHGISVGQSGGTDPYRWRLNNTPITFSSSAQTITPVNAIFIWENTASALPGSVPTVLFTHGSSTGGLQDIRCEGVDLSAMGSGKSLVDGAFNGNAKFKFGNCKLGASIAVLSTSIADQCGPEVDLVNCDDATAGRNYRFDIERFQGNVVQDIATIRTSGATDGATAQSWKVTTNANATFLSPLSLPVIPVRETNTGSSKTITVSLVANASAALNNDDVWLEVEALTASSAPLSAYFNNAKADPLTSNAAQPTDTASAWDSAGTARQNSHAYSVGDVHVVASNAGRVFICTASSGSSAASEPGGYASAVDGGSVTDGSCTFRAGVRQKLQVSVTPQMVGYIKATVKVGKPSLTIWVDPIIQGL